MNAFSTKPRFLLVGVWAVLLAAGCVSDDQESGESGQPSSSEVAQEPDTEVVGPSTTVSALNPVLITLYRPRNGPPTQKPTCGIGSPLWLDTVKARFGSLCQSDLPVFFTSTVPFWVPMSGSSSGPGFGSRTGIRFLATAGSPQRVIWSFRWTQSMAASSIPPPPSKICLPVCSPRRITTEGIDN